MPFKIQPSRRRVCCNKQRASKKKKQANRLRTEDRINLFRLTWEAKFSSSSRTHLPALRALRNTPSRQAKRAVVPLALDISAESESGTGRSEPKRSDTSVCSERLILTNCRRTKNTQMFDTVDHHTLVCTLASTPRGVDASNLISSQSWHKTALDNFRKHLTSCPVAAARADIRLVLPTPGLPSSKTALRTCRKQ